MSERRADYDEIAQVYDQVRVSEAPHLEWWYRRLAELGRLGPGRRLVDLGCGTGRWTLPFARRTDCTAIGVDSSEEMLARAREKDRGGQVTWVLADVETMEPSLLPGGPCDCALMSLMMHHLRDFVGTFRSVYSLLRPGGVFLIRQGTLDDIEDHPRYRLFPETLTIDRKRTPFTEELVAWLEEAGFSVAWERRTQTTYEDLERLLRELRLRVTSVLRLITDEQYERGMRRVEKYLAANPEDLAIRQDRFTLFSARKP